ncbi:MAG: acyl-CoA/acyl-ACP dehydrogenase [Gammaproteobacteria bacterium]|nr:acyl-CoA/acyl-ACP dehydrogenase [Gammaproteobacteria bacterium]
MSDVIEAYQSEELELLRDQIRRFMRDFVKPIEDKLPYNATGCGREERALLKAKAAEMGLTRLSVPAEYGGNPVSALTRVVIAEESAKCRLGAYAPALGAFGGGPPNVIWTGTPQQIEKYGVPCVEGKKRAFVAITEPTGGSDPRNNISTSARKEGDVWLLNGRKMWITAAEGADYGIIFAKTKDGTDGNPPQITAFIVEPTFPGISFNEIKVIRALSPYEIVLENCEVPAENVLGEVGQGFGVAQRWLVDARIPYAAGCVGIAQEALDMACGWVKQRPTRDGMLADKQAIQWMIADSEVELKAARLLVYDAASKVDAGEPGKVDASVCKLVATETAGRVVDRAMQMFGGMGMAQEMPLERWYRELRVKRIGEGPSEVHRMVIARDKLRKTNGGSYFG